MGDIMKTPLGEVKKEGKIIISLGKTVALKDLIEKLLKGNVKAVVIKDGKEMRSLSPIDVLVTAILLHHVEIETIETEDFYRRFYLAVTAVEDIAREVQKWK